jgi:hypothetical protein
MDILATQIVGALKYMHDLLVTRVNIKVPTKCITRIDACFQDLMAVGVHIMSSGL